MVDDVGGEVGLLRLASGEKLLPAAPEDENRNALFRFTKKLLCMWRSPSLSRYG